MRVNAGELNRKIEIVQVEKIKDADGYHTENDRVILRPWAKVTRMSGTEKLRHDADFAEITCRFLIRYTSKQLSRKMVVRHGGDRYEIQYLNNYGESNDYIEIVAKLITMGG